MAQVGGVAQAGVGAAVHPGRMRRQEQGQQHTHACERARHERSRLAPPKAAPPHGPRQQPKYHHGNIERRHARPEARHPQHTQCHRQQREHENQQPGPQAE